MDYKVQPIVYSPLYKALHDLEAKSVPLNNQVTNLLISDKKPKRSINVSGHGELSLPPDKAKLIILIRSVKENINEAKNSVNRRFEYIYQTLKKYRVPVNINSSFLNYRLMFEF